MEEVVKGSNILRTERQLTNSERPKWVIWVTWELKRQEMLPGNRMVLAVEDTMFLKKLHGRRSKNAWGGTERCSKGLKWQETLCSCGRTKGVGSIWRGKREFNCVWVQFEGVECIYLTWLSAYSSFFHNVHVASQPLWKCEEYCSQVY